MEQFIQILTQNIPETAQIAITLVFYFLVFLYRKRFKNTSEVLTLSMKEVLGDVHTGRSEDAEIIKALETRLAKCEAALRIYTIDEGGHDHGTEGTAGT